jgi:hypothetical protein
MTKLLQLKTHSNWLALPDVARRLSLSTERVLSLIRTGQLDARLVAGRRWFVHVNALERFRDRHRRSA